MYLIKKYSNRKLYDTVEKKYITMKALATIIKSGEDIRVIENDTGDDITTSIVSNLIVNDHEDPEKTINSGILFQLIRKGGDAFSDYKKKYSTLVHEAFTTAEEEIDKLIKNKEISNSEGNRLKEEITGFTSTIKTLITDTIDRKLHEILNRMNLTTKDQLLLLEKKIETLEKRITDIEKQKK